MQLGTVALFFSLIALSLCPVVVADNTNLVASTDWATAPYGYSTYCYYDTSVTYNGHITLRMEADTDEATLEQPTADDRATYPNTGEWGTFECISGDHILFKAWIKTESSVTSNGMNDKGARIGIDFYSNNSRIMTSPPNVPEQSAGSYVEWNNPIWQYFEYDITVPTDYDIDLFIPWLQCTNPTDTAKAWFYTEIYLNPTQETTPTPTPHITNVPYPTDNWVPIQIGQDLPDSGTIGILVTIGIIIFAGIWLTTLMIKVIKD